jgi:glyoxylase-like metal-dependent hydrolase (beta-lactamase superfamily II)
MIERGGENIMTLTTIAQGLPLAAFAWALAFLAGASPVSAASPEPVAESAAYALRGGLVLQLGDFEVFALIDRSFTAPAGSTAGGVTPVQWDRARHLLTPDGKIGGATGGFLIRSKTSNRLVLVDLGIGLAVVPPMFPPGEHTMIQELAALGYKPEDITDVVFTHLHLDHIGWATTGGKPTFPNAVYRCGEADWQSAVVNPVIPPQSMFAAAIRAQRDILLPVKPQLEALKQERLELYPGLVLRLVPGHTKGSIVVQLDSGGRRALLLGDAAHSPMELQDRDWPGTFDGDHEPLARAVRSRLIDEAIAADAEVSVAHMPGLRFGRIVQTANKGLLFYFNEK